MRLLSATIEGYKRFAEKTTVRLDDLLIALVGPNEAGKTSILRALAGLEMASPYDPKESTRGGVGTPRVEVTYRLDESDRAALADVPGGPLIERVTVRKNADGSRAWIIDPYPFRDKKPRGALLAALRDADPHAPTTPITGRPEITTAELLRRILQQLDTIEETLSAAVVNDLKELRTSLTQVPLGDSGSEHELDWTTLVDAIAEVLSIETAPHPSSSARDILDARRPS